VTVILAVQHAGVNIDDGYNNGNSRYNKIHDCEFYGGADYDRAFLMNAILQSGWMFVITSFTGTMCTT